MFLVVFPHSDVSDLLVAVDEFTFSVFFVIFKLAYVDFPAIIIKSTVAMHLILHPITSVAIFIFKDLLSKTVDYIIFPVSIVGR